MLSYYNLVQVLGIRACMEGTFWLPVMCEGRYPFGQFGDQGDDTKGNNLLQCLLDLLTVLNGYLPLGMLDWVTDGSVQMV